MEKSSVKNEKKKKVLEKGLAFVKKQRGTGGLGEAFRSFG